MIIASYLQHATSPATAKHFDLILLKKCLVCNIVQSYRNIIFIDLSLLRSCNHGVNILGVGKKNNANDFQIFL